jgi:hypothetical protein
MDSVKVEQTRRALHAVAELLLAGPQYRTSGTIKLKVCPGGFRTHAAPDLQVDGAELIAGERRLTIAATTPAELGQSIGITPGEPEDLYPDGSGTAADDRIEADAATARWITDCFETGDAALRRLSPESEPVLWPEHFDVGIILGGVGYGVSAGDGYINEPYAYLSVSNPPADEFWNAPFGAAKSVRELRDVDGILTFFEAGRRISTGGSR